MNWLIYVTIAVTAATAREITQKRALQHEHTSEYLTIRNAIIVALTLPFLAYADFTFALNGYLAIAAAAGVVTAGVMYKNTALKQDDVSKIEPLLNLQPFFVTLLAYTLLNEALTTTQLTGVAAIIAGTYWLETDSEHHSFTHVYNHLIQSKHALYVITASFLFALANIIARYVLTNHTNTITYFFFAFALTGILLSLTSIEEYGVDELITVTEQYGWAISIPAVLTAVQILSLYQALSLASAGLVIALYTTRSVFTTLEACITCGEGHMIHRTTAAVLTAAGAAVIIL